MSKPVYFTLWLLGVTTVWFLLITFASRNNDTATQLRHWPETVLGGLALGTVLAYLQTGIYFGNRRKREQAKSEEHLQARIAEELAAQEKEQHP